MSVEVVMPQMGESITEGTVSKWLKNVGDKIEKDEPILEISTDKVDAEVPSPGEGTLLEVRHAEGETVEVGTVLAVIGAEGEVSGTNASSAAKTRQTPESEAAIVAPPEAQTPAGSENVITSVPTDDTQKSESGKSTEVVMPQMGESITEGTVSKWLKSLGDPIEKDEPLLEISTDKVDAEVPSPVSGKIIEIRVAEGETIEVGAVVAVIGGAGDAAVLPFEAAVADKLPTEEKPDTDREEKALSAGSNGHPRPTSDQVTVDDLRRTKSSPLVRNIAREHNIDITRISGSGLSGRVTKKDIISFIDSGAALRPQDLLKKGSTAVSEPVPVTLEKADKQSPAVSTTGDRVEKMSVMRKKIAEHMMFSKQTSAHVTSVYEIDMTNVARLREKNKSDFQSRYGTKLTYMPFIFEAVNASIRKYPVVNAQVVDDTIVYKGNINLGIAVALDWGLIVPVIKDADKLSLSGLALAANDLADRARAKKLSPDEVTGGTFTITNPGVFGGLFGTPIINQPQVAILCVGTIEKRPKVITSADGEDYIAIRQMAYLALTYDHRIVDGADAERFLASMKDYLETANFGL